MRILFFTHYFPPEVNAPANRTHEHCREWVRAGHEVHVITCVPSHPRGVPFPGHHRGWYQPEQIDGITVHRVWTLLAPNSGVIKRTMNFLSFMPTAIWRALRLGGFDIIIGTSPQFFCAVATWMAATLKQTPWVFELRDLWPESIEAVGAGRAYMPLQLLHRLEMRMYRSARMVACLSHAFLDNLASRGISRSKMVFVPNGVDAAFWKTGSRDAGRTALQAGPDELLVSYIGTVGMAHDLGTILDVAARVKAERTDVRFVIVGDGAELPTLRERASREGLTNVTFTGLVPRERIPDYLAASDVSLVTLKRSDVFKAVLPSKMFESMAAATPILLAVEGEAQQILMRSGGGATAMPGDASSIASALAIMLRNVECRRAMGAAGAQFVEQEFSRTAWARRYIAALEQAAQGELGGARRPSEISTTPSRVRS
jgi:glycosyltransferase involved in cell wall biosynthesis